MNRIVIIFYILYNKLRFRRLGVQYGAKLRVYTKIYLKIGKKAKVTVGNNLRYTSGGGINPLCRNTCGYIRVDNGAQFTIGDNVGISSAVFWVKESVTIGNNVLVGGDSVIIDTDSHQMNWEGRRDKSGDYLKAKSKPIVIEDDVMIGTRCIILKGVRIGARSVIAAGSVVTKDVPSDCVAGGNPCHVIRQS